MTAIHSALIVNDCRNDDLLTLREFVWPIQRSLPIPSRVVSLKKLKESDVNHADLIIFSGCQLKDNEYVNHIPKLKWLVKLNKPMMGICAGHQILGSVFGGKLTSGKTPSIGMRTVTKTREHALTESLDSSFSVYSLHGNAVSLPKGFVSLAKSSPFTNEVMVHSTKPIVGVSFHPEVANKSFFSAFVKWSEGFNFD